MYLFVIPTLILMNSNRKDSDGGKPLLDNMISIITRDAAFMVISRLFR
jgi:hypothetical protein